MSEPTIAQKSPFVLNMKPGTYWWCACGKSKSQPFCDGSHKGSGFAPLKAEIAEEKTVAWCGCKHSKYGCFCDGNHSKLA
jgi:CDGSH-type Zn-finger protein